MEVEYDVLFTNRQIDGTNQSDSETVFEVLYQLRTRQLGQMAIYGPICL